MGERCCFSRLHAHIHTGLCNRCDRGKDASQTATLWQTLCISNSVGRRLMCASMTSVAMVHGAPKMVVTAIHCMDSSRFVTLTDLIALVPCVVCITGAYHTSAAYGNLGTATAQYSCLMNLDLMPVDSFVRRRNCSVHLAAAAVARSACSHQQSSWSKITPKYLCTVDGLMMALCRWRSGRASGASLPGHCRSASHLCEKPIRAILLSLKHNLCCSGQS